MAFLVNGTTAITQYRQGSFYNLTATGNMGTISQSDGANGTLEISRNNLYSGNCLNMFNGNSVGSLSYYNVSVTTNRGDMNQWSHNSPQSGGAPFTGYKYLVLKSSGDTGDNEFILWGNGYAQAEISWAGGGADYAEYFEWEDGNPENEDRVGKTVSMVGSKIKIAEPGEQVIGVISAMPVVIGDAAWSFWAGKYLKDEFGRFLSEDYEVYEWEEFDEKTGEYISHSYETDKVPEGVTIPEGLKPKKFGSDGERLTRRILNPNFDPTKEYEDRSSRKEWDLVGLMGKLRIYKNQTVDSRWIKMRDISDQVEEWLVR